MDLEDEIFGSPEKVTPVQTSESFTKPRQTPEDVPTPVQFVIPTLHLSTLDLVKKPKPSLLDLEDEILAQQEVTPKKSPVKMTNVPVVDLEKELFSETPKRRPTVLPTDETPRPVTPKDGKGLEKLASIRNKKIEQEEINKVTLTQTEMKNLTSEEQAQVKRIRAHSHRRSTKMKRKEKDIDDFDGMEYIRATKKEGYLIKPNSDSTKAYKRYCVATKLGDMKIVFLVFTSKKAVTEGEPINKYIVTEDVNKETTLFKTQKKSSSFEAGKEFHDSIVIRQGNSDPVRFWCMEEFDAKEWELTLKCMMYFDEDSGDDESDSEDDEKTKKEKRSRRRKREIEKIKEREERKKKQGCFGKLWDLIKE
jgi:hypothetical protein